MRAARAARVRERHEQQEREAGTCKVLLAGIDTLNMSSSTETAPAVLAELVKLKAEAIEQAQEGAELPRWRSKALGADLEVQPSGTKKGDLVLKLDDALVLIVHSRPPRNLPAAYVELKAPFLWSGWERASDKAVELLREISAFPGSVDPQVSRVDLAVDFMGWQPDPSLLDHVIGRVVRRDQNFEPHRKTPTTDEGWWRLHGRGRSFTGFTFGGGQLLARLYDKTVEMRKHGKTWFVEKWKANGYVNEETSGHVWRLEFQVRREPLRKAELVTHAMKNAPKGEVGPGMMTVKSWADLRVGLNDLWRYLTKKWLAYRLPRTGRERVRIHPRWKILAAAQFVDLPDGELIRHQRLWNEQQYLGALAGYIARELPLDWKAQGHAPNEHRFEADLDRLIKKALTHFENKHGGTLFEAARARWRDHRDRDRMFGAAS